MITKTIPARLLPEALRGSIPEYLLVEVTVADRGRQRAQPTIADVEKYLAERADPGPSLADAVVRVNELRDEWDDH